MSRAGDEWFRRNAKKISTSYDLDQTSVGGAIARLSLPDEGRLIDVGGANGHIANAFKRDFPSWDVVVIDISKEACSEGKRMFPELAFFPVDITRPTGIDSLGHFDLVIVAGVLPMIPRNSLAHAIANLDSLVHGQAGKLLIRDFATAIPSVSLSKHGSDQKIYKQSYSPIFESLGHYIKIFSEVVMLEPQRAHDEDSFFDRLRSTEILQKNNNDDFYRLVK